MAELNKMYEGVANSPDTFLTSALASGGTVLYVADGSVFGTLPNLAVLGTGGNAETILVLEKRSDNGYDIQRAIEGLARDWPQATIAARNFTNYDYKNLKYNIQKLNENKVEKTEIINDLTSGGIDKALSAEQGKVLFQNVDNGKDLVANAIIDKGQADVSKDSTFAQLAAKISAIKTGYGIGDVIDKNNLEQVTTETVPTLKSEIGLIVNGISLGEHGDVYLIEGNSSSDSKLKKMTRSMDNVIWEVTLDHNPKNLNIDENEDLIFSAGSSVFKYSKNGEKIFQKNYSEEIDRITTDKLNNIYVVLRSKVICYNSTGVFLWEFTVPETIYSILVDNELNIYLGGIILYKYSSERVLQWQYTGHNSTIYSIALDRDGNTLSGGMSKKAIRVSKTGNKIEEFSNSGSVQSIVVDSNNNFFTGGNDKKVIKRTSDGTKIWEILLEYTVMQVTVDMFQKVYITFIYRPAKIYQENITLVGYKVLA